MGVYFWRSSNPEVTGGNLGNGCHWVFLARTLGEVLKGIHYEGVIN